MTGLAASPTGLRQVALAGGDDLDETLAFWRDVIGLDTYARFDPPGIAFILVGSVRLYFAQGTPPATIYLDEPRLLEFSKAAEGIGVHFMSPPAIVHVDKAGEFGLPGEAEWMAFLQDPAGNTIGLVERRPHEISDTGLP
jgi:catechol 2,3-dioxygenase-like lactoylglutathione lyase family enzyme